MNDKKDCKIIQDLLPNYVENVTTDETNIYIENHLKTCEECKNIYTSMNETLNISPTTIEEKEVKYMKKFHKELNVLKFIILIVCFLFIFSISRKTFIMCLLNNKHNETEKKFYNNYYAKQTSYEAGQIIENTIYSKGTNHYITYTNIVKIDNQNIKLTYYKKDEDEFQLLDIGNKKVKQESGVTGYFGFADDIIPSSIYDKIISSFTVKIETIYVRDKECYVIKHKNIDRIIDKETGIMIKEIDYKSDKVTEWIYELGTVNDSDIENPNIIEYIKP